MHDGGLTLVLLVDFEKATHTEPFGSIPFAYAMPERGKSLRNIFVREEGESDDGEDEDEEAVGVVEEAGDGEEEGTDKAPSPLP